MTEQILRLVAPFLTLLFCVEFTASELRLFFYGGWRTRHWQAADAIVVHVEIRRGPVANGRYTYYPSYPSVIYRYLVGDREYHSNHLGYRGGWFTFRGDIPWKAGQSVRVSYDPARPSH